jgi:hypothetical protein
MGITKRQRCRTPSLSVYPATPCNVNKCKHALRHRKRFARGEKKDDRTDDADRNASCVLMMLRMISVMALRSYFVYVRT